MATNWGPVTRAGGDLKLFQDPATEPDFYSFGALTRPQVAGGMDMLVWRSVPAYGGTNSNPFRVLELRAWPKQWAGPALQSIPQIIRPGWSKFSMGNVAAAAQKDLNVFLSVGYQQQPLVGHPTPAAFPALNADPGQPQGFHFWDNPIGAIIPAPLFPSGRGSCWTVVLAMDSAARVAFAGSPGAQTFEFAMTYEGVEGGGQQFSVQNP